MAYQQVEGEEEEEEDADAEDLSPSDPRSNRSRLNQVRFSGVERNLSRRFWRK